MPVYSSDSNNEKAQRAAKRELDLAIHKLNSDHDGRRDQVNKAKMAKRMKKELRRQQREAS